jgi:heterodisulfide reductase subunit A-like polyferredoxin
MTNPESLHIGDEWPCRPWTNLLAVDDSASYDLLIVGGGINGVAIARDATGRGLKALLLERDELASHTSSASTNLIQAACGISSTVNSVWCAKP